MDASYGFSGQALNGLGPPQSNAFVLAGTTDTGKPILVPVQRTRKGDLVQLSNAKKAPKKNFFGKAIAVTKGFGKAAIESIRSLFSIKGLLVAAGTVALAAVVGPAIIPFMVAAGFLTGCVQITKAHSSGNWEGVGAGLFTAGSSMLGAKFAPKSARNMAGEELRLTQSATGWMNRLKKPNFITEMLDGTKNQLRLVLGGKITNTVKPDQSTNIYKLARESVSYNWKTLKQQAVTLKESQSKFNRRIDEISQSNPQLKQAIQDTLGTDGKVSLNPTRSQSNNPEVQAAIQQFAKEQPVAWNVNNTVQSAGVGLDTFEKMIDGK